MHILADRFPWWVLDEMVRQRVEGNYHFVGEPGKAMSQGRLQPMVEPPP